MGGLAPLDIEEPDRESPDEETGGIRKQSTDEEAGEIGKDNVASSSGHFFGTQNKTFPE